MSQSESIKTFIHQFTDGQTITLEFDMSGDMPSCKSSLQMKGQPISICAEYRIWTTQVVMPLVLDACTQTQFENLMEHGAKQV